MILGNLFIENIFFYLGLSATGENVRADNTSEKVNSISKI